MLNNRIPLVAVMLLLMGVATVSGCSSETPDTRQIRAHNLLKAGIPHAQGLNHADRLCQSCHGVGLQGGEQNAVPSCYQCHGQNWGASRPDQSRAPADHTVIKDIFLHKESLMAPLGDCDSCHGAALEGSVTAPSCLLCHEQKWP